jgi:hypothetical protein
VSADLEDAMKKSLLPRINFAGSRVTKEKNPAKGRRAFPEKPELHLIQLHLIRIFRAGALIRFHGFLALGQRLIGTIRRLTISTLHLGAEISVRTLGGRRSGHKDGGQQGSRDDCVTHCFFSGETISTEPTHHAIHGSGFFASGADQPVKLNGHTAKR